MLLPHPVHAAFVTKHAWTPGSFDGSHRIASLLWACGPNGVLPETAGSTSRAGTRGRYGWPPAALSQARCVALAGRGAVRSPRGSCLRSGTSPWPAGNRFMASRRCARRRVAPVRAPRGCRRAGGRRRPRYASCHSHCRVFTRRSRVRVLRLWRRCAVPLVKLGPVGPTLPLRSELAGSGWDYGRRRVMRANVCVNGWRAGGTAMAGQPKRPAIAGRARCSLFVASLCEWRLSTHRRGRGTRRVVLSHVELSAHGRRVRCGEAERAKVRRRGGGRVKPAE